jgi:hypothetical protein
VTDWRLRVAAGIARGVAVVTVALLAVVVGAPSAGAGPSDLPPPKLKALSKEFKDELQPLGLRVSRGLLQNETTYRPDPDGKHLALYVEPKSSRYSWADYVANFTKLTHAFVPMVFNRWTGLKTFDICQEPLDATREAPPPVTQIFVSRDALDRVASWKQATLTELLAAAPAERRAGSDYYVYFNGTTRADPTFRQAAQAAGYTTGAFGY